MQSYRDLEVWQRATSLVLQIYLCTDKFPTSERHGIVNQIRRAAVSIPSNIAEVYSHRQKQDYLRFLRIAFASGAELETQLFIARQLAFISDELYQNIEKDLSDIMRMLNKLMYAIKTKYH